MSNFIVNYYAGTLFVPHSGGGGVPTTNLWAYYEGDNGATTAQWSDLSGNGRHLTQPTTINQPSISSPIYTFTNGTNPQYFKLSGVTLPATYTIYFVVSFAVASFINYVYIDNTTSGTIHHAYYNSSNNSVISCDGSTSLTDTTTINDNTFYLVKAYFNNTSSQVQVNNNAATNGSAGTGAQQGNIYIASDGNFGFPNFSIKAMYIYSGLGDDTTVKPYTTGKWGLP